jgi:hypothetical protein
VRLRPDRPNVMMDIETLSLKPDAHILSVAAVSFDATGPNETYRADFGLVKQGGRDISLATVHWHLDQGTDMAVGMPYQVGMAGLRAFLVQFDGVRVWAKSPDFDCVIVANALRALGYVVPWRYAHTRCVRTVCDGVPDLPTHKSMGLSPHDPTDDCLVQIACVLKALA